MMSMINGGTTVLYVSHSPESVKQLCNRVIWINRGRQIKVGNAKKICDENEERIKG